jgi:protocatechuate 3,4-dioxygenase beta subunit
MCGEERTVERCRLRRPVGSTLFLRKKFACVADLGYYHNMIPTTSLAQYQNRRDFLSRVGLVSTLFVIPGAFAEALQLTPAQTEGPFYPDKLPLDTDNDLLILNDSATPALGEVTWLNGRILDSRGEPIRNALVEIWQCDAKGVYLHRGSSASEKRDANFQGFGRFLTGSSGEYQFRTIKPVAYPGRTPHIHFAVKYKGRDKFTTQCYIQGEPRNHKDGVLNGIRDKKARESVIVPFAPLPGSKVGELAARFNIVMGFTPES